MTTPGNPARNFKTKNLPMLPDTGIGWMILSVPNAGLPTGHGQVRRPGRRLPATWRACRRARRCRSSCPARPRLKLLTYSRRPATDGAKSGIQVAQGPDARHHKVNTGLSFYNNLDYLYDPIGGFVGYRANRYPVNVASLIVPLLAMQGTLSVQNGFATTLPGVADGRHDPAAGGLRALSSGAISGTGGLTVGSGRRHLGGREQL